MVQKSSQYENEQQEQQLIEDKLQQNFNSYSKHNYNNIELTAGRAKQQIKHNGIGKCSSGSPKRQTKGRSSIVHDMLNGQFLLILIVSTLFTEFINILPSYLLVISCLIQIMQIIALFSIVVFNSDQSSSSWRICTYIAIYKYIQYGSNSSRYLHNDSALAFNDDGHTANILYANPLLQISTSIVLYITYYCMQQIQNSKKCTKGNSISSRSSADGNNMEICTAGHACMDGDAMFGTMIPLMQCLGAHTIILIYSLCRQYQQQQQHTHQYYILPTNSQQLHPQLSILGWAYEHISIGIVGLYLYSISPFISIYCIRRNRPTSHNNDNDNGNININGSTINSSNSSNREGNNWTGMGMIRRMNMHVGNTPAAWVVCQFICISCICNQSLCEYWHYMILLMLNAMLVNNKQGKHRYIRVLLVTTAVYMYHTVYAYVGIGSEQCHNVQQMLQFSMFMLWMMAMMLLYIVLQQYMCIKYDNHILATISAILLNTNNYNSHNHSSLNIGSQIGNSNIRCGDMLKSRMVMATGWYMLTKHALLVLALCFTVHVSTIDSYLYNYLTYPLHPQLQHTHTTNSNTGYQHQGISYALVALALTIGYTVVSMGRFYADKHHQNHYSWIYGPVFQSTIWIGIFSSILYELILILSIQPILFSCTPIAKYYENQSKVHAHHHHRQNVQIWNIKIQWIFALALIIVSGYIVVRDYKHDHYKQKINLIRNTVSTTHNHGGPDDAHLYVKKIIKNIKSIQLIQALLYNISVIALTCLSLACVYMWECIQIYQCWICIFILGVLSCKPIHNFMHSPHNKGRARY